MSQNYKETLNLPKTDFPMKADLVAREPQRLADWEQSGLYERIQDARKDAPLFVLHDGPPFANGDVHMGTALNKILKDIIVKSRTMLGFRAPFIPGWDCHGLPIEFKVVKESRGLAPAEIRRRSEEYARKYIGIQREQFKRLGVFGDWENPYLTLDPGYEAEVIRAFATFVEKGLVYQSKKPVYWSTGAQTALAEAEVEYVERTDPAIFVKFPLTVHSIENLDVPNGTSMVIWTTTPWTLPANVAIAVAPKAKYTAANFENAAGELQPLIIAEELVAKFEEVTGLKRRALPETEPASFDGADLSYRGLKAQHPFLDRKADVITADFVTLDTGTGQVHIAPGHGKDDYLAGQQNGLPVLSPVDDFGKFTEDVGMPEWVGKYVFDANAEIVAFLREKGALLAEQKYVHEYPHCWRSKTPIVFRAVEQFFIRIDDIRAAALKAIDDTTWIPEWGRNRIFGTVESRPDWCISRQRTWGVPLPVFYAANGAPIIDGALARKVAEIVEKDGTNVWFEHDDAWWAQTLGLPAGTTRRNDTLDVWMDSGVSHQAVVAKNPALKAAKKADVYIEATDQHRGWFQSSLLTSIAITGEAPYRSVITHGFVVDKDTRKKVSKSAQGTYTKPMDAMHFVNKYGADIVRLWASSVEFTNEVPFSEESFKVLTDAYRSFRNILRILLANLSDFDPANASLERATVIDRWMLSRLQEVIATSREAYESYDFRKVFQTLNQFVAVEVSALYVDITKDRLYCDALGSSRRRATQAVMAQVFDALARLLAPILSFTSDEAWKFLGNENSVHLELFPSPVGDAANDEAAKLFSEAQNLRSLASREIEQKRQEKLLGSSLEAAVQVELAANDASVSAYWKTHVEELEELLIVSELSFSEADQTTISVGRTGNQKCQRCWRHRAAVGKITAQPDLCDRCAEVVAAK
jgi:isoleucyl-tRNA synthetase